MNCHACGEPVEKGQGEISHCLGGYGEYLELSRVLIHATKKCRDFQSQINHHCYTENPIVIEKSDGNNS